MYSEIGFRWLCLPRKTVVPCIKIIPLWYLVMNVYNCMNDINSTDPSLLIVGKGCKYKLRIHLNNVLYVTYLSDFRDSFSYPCFQYRINFALEKRNCCISYQCHYLNINHNSNYQYWWCLDTFTPCKYMDFNYLCKKYMYQTFAFLIVVYIYCMHICWVCCCLHFKESVPFFVLFDIMTFQDEIILATIWLYSKRYHITCWHFTPSRYTKIIFCTSTFIFVVD